MHLKQVRIRAEILASVVILDALQLSLPVKVLSKHYSQAKAVLQYFVFAMEESSRRTPSVKELNNILFGGKRFGNHVDEVWPRLFIGDASVANDRYVLWKLGITHVVNAAHGSKCCQGGRHFYGPAVDYYAVPAADSPTFDLSPYFLPCARYIDNALNTTDASVLVHCAVGVSRSASLVLAYLMIRHGLSLLEAVRKVKHRRWIFPNVGFLKQLRALDDQLARETPPHRPLQESMPEIPFR
ncbi:dual specificity protein phosphatase 13A-like [Vanacampus margaritifer]